MDQSVQSSRYGDWLSHDDEAGNITNTAQSQSEGQFNSVWSLHKDGFKEIIMGGNYAMTSFVEWLLHLLL